MPSKWTYWIGADMGRRESRKVIQATCKHCGQDIENFAPYRKGEWRDRGNNTHCPTPEGDAGQVNQPYREPR